MQVAPVPLQEHPKTSLNWRFGEQFVYYRAVVAVLVLLVVWLLSGLAHALGRAPWEEWQGWLLTLSVVSLAVIVVFLWLDYIKPSQYLRSWLLNIHAGDLSSRVPEVPGSGFNVFCRDFNSMAHMLEAQSRYGVAQLQRHTEHMTDKTRMQERAWIAYELHDSLAQTVGGLRFQVRVLDQSLRDGDEVTARRQLDKVENTLEEANREVRALINYFHTTSRVGALERSVEEVILRFRGDNPDIQVFFHKDWPRHTLPREFEIQVLKVIQEALTNVQKHAHADLVRVMMRGTADGHYRVLIEDNGVGMDTDADYTGKCIGLSAMKSRAAHIGSSLSLESERGEGTRVVLDFSVAPLRVDERTDGENKPGSSEVADVG